ncbi:MAG: hypothetical protein C4334_15190 [Pyrinomonas sp.]
MVLSDAMRPLILLTMRCDPERDVGYLARDYAAALVAAGGAPVHLALVPEPEYICAAMEMAAGVLLPGSASDVDPRLYGQERRAGLGAVDELRDRVEMMVLREAERRGLPLLAICYGMQAWNVFRGGTLIQDLGRERSGAMEHEQRLPRGERWHKVRFARGSLLAELAGAEELMVNSHHHQAVDRLGTGLRATAWAEDGTIEGIEERGERFAVGVQWHPEVGWAHDRLARALFARFVEACKKV